MARGGVSFEGIKFHNTTYRLKTADTLTAADVGKALTVTATQEAGLGSAGDVLLGRLEIVGVDGLGSIQDGGYAQFDYPSGQAPALKSCVVVNGAGLVSQAGAGFVGKGNIVVELDTTNRKCFVFLG